MKPLREILAAVYGREAGPYARRLWLSMQDPYAVALVRPLVEMSRAIVTHSEYARSLVLRDSPGTPVHVIPMGMPPADLSCRESIRAAHGIRPDDFVLASVSTLSHTKRIEVLLDGAILAARRYPQLRIFVLGGGRLSDRARRAIRASGFEDRIWLAGWTPASTYDELLVAVDAVADLRYPSGAETSASVLRAIAAGRPAIVSAQGSFLELPEDFAIRIEVGGDEPTRVERAIARLIDDPHGRATMSDAAQSWARRQLSLENAATRYMEAGLDAMNRTPRRTWNLAPAESNASRRFWSGTYKVSRVGYMYRNYGLGPTLRRLKSEAGLSRAV
jgi:glycosyltransferase involved in cell wall biosynthesis